MKLMISSAALALLAVSTPAAAQYGSSAPQPQPTVPPQQQQAVQQAPSVKVSARASKAIRELQAAVKANDVANIPAKVAAAQAVASTKEDRYLIALFQFQAARAANDLTTAASAADAMANSGVLNTQQLAALYLDLGAKQFDAKQFPAAAASFQRAATLTPTDPEAIDLLARGQAAAGQMSEAAATYQRLIQLRSASGQKPDADLYKRAFSAAYHAKSPAAIDLSRAWVAAYPSPESWHNAIAMYRNTASPDVEGTLVLLRLMQATGAMTSSADYLLFAEAAADQLNYNEAQAVLNAGIAAKALNPSSSEIRELQAFLKAKPQLTAADLESALKMTPKAVNLLRIGDRFYAMGNYSRAAEIYRQVISSPGADKDVANLHLGMALARAGDKAGATAALKAVGGTRAGVAALWLTYVQQLG